MHNLVPRLFVGGRKDPGRGWSGDTAKTVSPRGCRESIKLHASTTVNVLCRSVCQIQTTNQPNSNC